MSEPLFKDPKIFQMLIDMAKGGRAGPNVACALAMEVERLRRILRGVVELSQDVDMKYRAGDGNELGWHHCNPYDTFIPCGPLYEALKDYHDGSW